MANNAINAPTTDVTKSFLASQTTSDARDSIDAAESGMNGDINDLTFLTTGIQLYNNPQPPNFINGTYILATAGESLTLGNPCFVGTDGNLYKGDASDPSKFPIQYIAGESLLMGEGGKFFLLAAVRNLSATYSAGDLLYLANGGGYTNNPSGLTRKQPIAFAASNILVIFSPVILDNIFSLSGNNSDLTSLNGITGNVNSNSSPSSDLSTSGQSFSFVAGENLAFGDICYLKSDGKIWKGNASTLFPVQYMATGTIAASATGLFIKNGFVRNDSWTWSPGGVLYLSTTSGAITQTAPVATDQCTQILGEALSATIIDFSPSRDYVTHA